MLGVQARGSSKYFIEVRVREDIRDKKNLKLPKEN